MHKHVRWVGSAGVVAVLTWAGCSWFTQAYPESRLARLLKPKVSVVEPAAAPVAIMPLPGANSLEEIIRSEFRLPGKIDIVAEAERSKFVLAEESSQSREPARSMPYATEPRKLPNLMPYADEPVEMHGARRLPVGPNEIERTANTVAPEGKETPERGNEFPGVPTTSPKQNPNPLPEPPTLQRVGGDRPAMPRLDEEPTKRVESTVLKPDLDTNIDVRKERVKDFELWIEKLKRSGTDPNGKK